MKYTKRLERWFVSLGEQLRGRGLMRRLAVVGMSLGLLVSCAGGSTTAQQLPTYLVPMSERASDSLVRVASDWLSTLTIEEQIGHPLSQGGALRSVSAYTSSTGALTHPASDHG